ncbi:hypothetical protein [Aliiruegeria lutimaris]|uniref:Uncharacterized protein n=1 Tax=Aliiruegeria lutimaris TaxID=571298 RepID=A0A1G8RQ54_9RHOB|nr:hypothetical protein [Aliiruegeria lutimaris]SDJ19066.1 hypothetical protein SAMN04488026_101380 [Aliiruegeria lutimaris]
MTNEMQEMPPIESLFDFFQRWGLLRPEMEALRASDRLGPRERTILAALIDLADRVGPDDLAPQDSKE